MKARPYQVQCLARIGESLSRHRSTLAVLATGLGKTVVFAHLAGRWSGRVLVIAHREELIRQAADKLQAITGETPGIEMGGEKVDETAADRSRLVVSSVQTMCRPKRREKFRPDEFGLVVIDEAHHAVARSYRSVIDYFGRNEESKLLGVTATPKRTDELAMGQVFESVCYEYGIEQAVHDGWLVPVHQQAIHVEGLDFSSVRTIAGDFSEDELERILSEEKILHRVAAPTVDVIGDRPALVFCVTVAHAKLMAEVLCRYRPGCAVSLDGKTDRDDRARTIDQFKAGDLQVLCNCNLFLEGFDAPTTAVVVMARPTKSLALYTQILGRGTRPLPGIVDGIESPEARRRAIATSAKPNMLVLDFVGNSGKHKIITASDLLGGKYTEPVRAYARKTAEDEKMPAPVVEGLKRAKDELALLYEMAERRRLAQIRARAEYRTRNVSPFDSSSGTRTAGSTVTIHEPATEKQIWYLVHRAGWKVGDARGLSKMQASAVIGKHRRAGWKVGDARGLSKMQASAVIGKHREADQ